MHRTIIVLLSVSWNDEKAYLLKNNSDYFDEIQRLAQFEQEYIIRQTEKSQPQK